jgi:hypothetical protein
LLRKIINKLRKFEYLGWGCRLMPFHNGKRLSPKISYERKMKRQKWKLQMTDYCFLKFLKTNFTPVNYSVFKKYYYQASLKITVCIQKTQGHKDLNTYQTTLLFFETRFAGNSPNEIHHTQFTAAQFIAHNSPRKNWWILDSARLLLDDC